MVPILSSSLPYYKILPFREELPSKRHENDMGIHRKDFGDDSVTGLDISIRSKQT
jgi:hypothetical protein